MARREGRGPTQRQLRVGEELRHVLAWILERADFRDPALSDAAVTVTEVRVSPDLKNATVFVTPLGGGDDERGREVLAGLNRARAFLRHQIGQSVDLKFTPRLSFQLDTSFDEARRIDALLRDPRVARDLEPHDGDGHDADADAGGKGGDDGA